jgi:hypothetical protein
MMAKVHSTFLRPRLLFVTELPNLPHGKQIRNEGAVGGLVFLASTPAANDSQRLEESVQDTDGALLGCLSDLLVSADGRTFLSVVHVNGSGAHDLLVAGPESGITQSCSASSALPEYSTCRPMVTIHDLLPALLVARARLRDLIAAPWDGAAGCIIYTFVLCVDVSATSTGSGIPETNFTVYTYVDFGGGLSDDTQYREVSFMGSLELLQQALVGCLNTPDDSNGHPLLSWLRKLPCIHTRVPICVVCVCGVDSPRALADTGLLLEQVAIQRIGGEMTERVLAGACQDRRSMHDVVAPQDRFSSHRITSSQDRLSMHGIAAPQDWFSSRRITSSHGMLTPEKTEWEISARSYSHEPDMQNGYTGSSGITGTSTAAGWSESPTITSSLRRRAGAPLEDSRAKINAFGASNADSVETLAEMHGGNLLKRISEELAKCNKELREKENAHIELARSKAMLVATRAEMEDLKQQNKWLRRQVHQYQEIFQRKDCLARLRRVFGTLAEQTVRKRKLLKFVVRFQGSTSVRTFRSWVEWLQSKRAWQARLVVVLSKMTQLQVVSALNAWMECTTKQRQHKHIIKKVLLRIENRNIAGAVNAWLSFHRAEKRSRQVLRKIAGRLTKRLQYSAFLAWHDTLAEAKQKLANMRRAVKYILGQLIAPAFTGWQSAVKKIGTYRVTLNRCISRLGRQQAHTAFLTWTSFVAEERRLQNLKLKILKRCGNALLAATVYTWQDNVVHVKRSRDLLRCSIMRWENVKLYKAFSTWFSKVASLTSKRELVQKVASMILHRGCSLAFSTWRELAKENAEQKVVLLKCFGRMTRRQLASALAGWHAATGKILTQKAIQSRAFKRLSSRFLAKAWNGWSTNIQILREHRILVRKSLTRLLQKSCASVLDAWIAFKARRTRERHIQQKCLGRLRQRCVTSAFDIWCVDPP